MSRPLKWLPALLAVAAVVTAGAWQSMSADEDLVHVVKGVVKSVDKDSKTMVIKTADGAEHTTKWTDKTTVQGDKDVAEGIVEGSKSRSSTQKWRENGGGREGPGQATAKAVNCTGKQAQVS